MSSPLRIADLLGRPSAIPPSTPIRPPRPTRFSIPVYTSDAMSPVRSASLKCKDVFGYPTPAPTRLAALEGRLRSLRAKPTVAPTVITKPAEMRVEPLRLSYPIATSTPARPRLTPRPFLAPVHAAADISPDAKAAQPPRGRDIFDYDTPAKPRVVAGPPAPAMPKVAESTADVVDHSILRSSSVQELIREETKKSAQRWRDKQAARQASRAAALSSAPLTTTTTTPPSTPPAAPVRRPAPAKSTRAPSSPSPSTPATTTPPSTPPAPLQRPSPAKPARAPPANVTPARLPSTSSTAKNKARGSKSLFDVTEQFLRIYSTEDDKPPTEDNVAASDLIKLAVEGLLEKGIVDKLDLRHLIAVLQPYAENNSRTDSEHTSRRSTAKPTSILKATPAGKPGSSTKPKMHVRFAPQAHVKLYKP